jgi:hypothetical protein
MAGRSGFGFRVNTGPEKFPRAGMTFASRFVLVVSFLGDQMGEVVEFPKHGPNRDEVRLIQEARALYESVFPTEKGTAVVKRHTPEQTSETHSDRRGSAARIPPLQ